MKPSTIVQWDIDEAEYVGSEEDGCYFQVAKGPRGWYVTTVVDCNSAGFVDTLHSDDGPYRTRAAALEAGRDTATEWCINNSIDYSSED